MTPPKNANPQNAHSRKNQYHGGGGGPKQLAAGPMERPGTSHGRKEHKNKNNGSNGKRGRGNQSVDYINDQQYNFIKNADGGSLAAVGPPARVNDRTGRPASTESRGEGAKNHAQPPRIGGACSDRGAGVGVAKRRPRDQNDGTMNPLAQAQAAQGLAKGGKGWALTVPAVRAESSHSVLGQTNHARTSFLPGASSSGTHTRFTHANQAYKTKLKAEQKEWVDQHVGRVEKEGQETEAAAIEKQKTKVSMASLSHQIPRRKSSADGDQQKAATKPHDSNNVVNLCVDGATDTEESPPAATKPRANAGICGSPDSSLFPDYSNEKPKAKSKRRIVIDTSDTPDSNPSQSLHNTDRDSGEEAIAAVQSIMEGDASASWTNDAMVDMTETDDVTEVPAQQKKSFFQSTLEYGGKAFSSLIRSPKLLLSKANNPEKPGTYSGAHVALLCPFRLSCSTTFALCYCR